MIFHVSRRIGPTRGQTGLMNGGWSQDIYSEESYIAKRLVW